MLMILQDCAIMGLSKRSCSLALLEPQESRFRSARSAPIDDDASHCHPSTEYSYNIQGEVVQFVVARRPSSSTFLSVSLLDRASASEKIRYFRKSHSTIGLAPLGIKPTVT